MFQYRRHHLPPKEGGLLGVLEYSRLVNAVIKRTFPKLLDKPENPDQIQVLDEPEGREVACALLHELETLTLSNGSALIVLVQRVEDEDGLFPTWSIATKRALSCLSDPATRVLDLKPA